MFKLNKWQKILILLYLFFVSVFSVFRMPMTVTIIEEKESKGLIKDVNKVLYEIVYTNISKIGYTNGSLDFLQKTNYLYEIDYSLYITHIGISLAIFAFLFMFVSLFKNAKHT